MNQDFKSLQLNSNDILIMTFDMLEFDIDEINSIFQEIKKIIPNNKILAIPKGIELSTLSMEDMENDKNLISWKVN